MSPILPVHPPGAVEELGDVTGTSDLSRDRVIKSSENEID